MAEPADIRRPEATRLRRFAVVAAFLALLIPLTWLARAWYVEDVAEGARAQQRAAVTEALDEIEQRFNAMQARLLERAEAVGESPAVVRGLRSRLRNDLRDGPADLVDYFVQLDVPHGSSVELYDAATQLVAWNGFSMPLDVGPSDRIRNGFQTAVASDDDVRKALVVWWPVREGTRVLGAVRVMRLIGFDAPVRNEYLRDVSLVDEWRRLTRLRVEVSFDPSSGYDRSKRSRLLQGADGAVLGRVSVEPPTREMLVEQANARFDDVLAFWVVLFLAWMIGGAWHLYRRSLEPRRLWRAIGWFGLVALLWWAFRFALLHMDVPGRWQPGKAPLAPLFDPMHLASDFGGGLMQSSGDVLLTALFFLLFAVAFLDLAQAFRDRATHFRKLRDRLRRQGAGAARSVFAAVGIVAAGTLIIQGLTFALALATRHVVLDSTFDFYARKGLMPEPLLLVVFSGLIILAVGVILASVGVVWVTASVVLRRTPDEMTPWTFWSAVAMAVAVPLVLVYSLLPVGSIVSWPVSLSLLSVAFALAMYWMLREVSVVRMLILRSILPSIFGVTVLLYPMLYNGMDAQRRIQMVDAAETFAEGHDPRVLFAIEQLLENLRGDARDVFDGPDAGRLDSLAAVSFRGSLLSALPAYDVSLTFFDDEGRPLGRYFDTGQVLDTRSLAQVDPLPSTILYQMYQEGEPASGVMVASVTGTREPDRLQYGGIAPIGDDGLSGWVTARVEPETVLREGGTPFPRVLLPSGSYDDLFTSLSIAEFRDGVLVRSMGRDFGRYRLSENVRQALAAEGSLWQTEVVEERPYRTYYRRQEQTLQRGDAALLPSTISSIVGVRVPSINTFDHLFYMLRVMVAGLFLGLPLYVLGLYLRRRAGLLPAPRVRFRDKVLNAFLGVGIISVAAVGIVGLEVVTGENERAVQSWLRQHLERVEETLAHDARDEEMPYRVLDRVRIDSLAARVGLDLNVYRDHRLVDLSRPQLIQERLIDERLPIEAYDALFFDGFRFIYTDARVGNFTYTTGFRALPDEQGSPRYVVSVPTLPEQERIEEERARTVAYLFGSLLLLLLVVMTTASLLANAISRPIARLRSGLQAVAAGRFERMLPVESRDEIGELVQTFNEMQGQLADSRRKLAQQERQLAWREMARQVAHEIKNPLTPMKLSVQHLRRAFQDAVADGGDADRAADRGAEGADADRGAEGAGADRGAEGAGADRGAEGADADRGAGGAGAADGGVQGRGAEGAKKFSSVFDRITTTLIEQIDTLARIANEFHSFARMPSRILERLDLNAVLEEAVALMQEESDVHITMDLCREPLIIEADREELRRIYINLIKNAIQAIPEGQEGRVEVASALQEPGIAYSSVADNGTGIEEAVRDRIFEPNFSTKTSGTGLGLAIAKKGVEELNGEIDFDTEEGEGTTFRIRLPLAEGE